LWPSLAFTVHFYVNVDGHTVACMKVHNRAKMPFYGDKNFDGVLELRNEWGDVLVHQEVPVLDRLPADEFTWPTAWKGTLTVGNYQWVWGTPDHGFTVVDFFIVERNGELYLDEEATKVSQVETFPNVKSMTPPNPPTSKDPTFLLPESAVPFQRASADLNGDGVTEEIALSGRPEARGAALAAGADAFVSKGDPPGRLLAEVNDCCQYNKKAKEEKK
jgi:hypothetical protein